MVIRVDFGSRDVANDVRDRSEVSEYLAGDDDRRKKTIKVKSNAPDEVRQLLEGEAADSRVENQGGRRQAGLSRAEKRRIDFAETNVLAARRIKGFARDQGVDDWLSYADLSLSERENLELLERAKRQETGGDSRLKGDAGTQAERDRKAARAFNASRGKEDERALDAAIVDADRDAQSFLAEEGAGVGGFDVRFERDTFDDRLEVFGADGDRLAKRHSRRSSRARRMDERRQARITRDPFKWANNPGRWDFPGIDTIDPARLHGERSLEARKRDEREIAPVPESVETWAMSPGRYDWPGVDLPAQGYGATSRTPIPTGELDRRGSGLFGGASESLEGLREEDAFFETGTNPRSSPEQSDELFEEMLDASRLDGSGGGGLGGSDATEEELREAYGGFADDSDQQGSLASFGMETDGSVYRESRQSVESATTFGVDDRSSADRGPSNNETAESEQGDLFGDGGGELSIREKAERSKQRGDRRGTLGALGGGFGERVAATERREASNRRADRRAEAFGEGLDAMDDAEDLFGF